jgi:hypothetical protein
MHPASALLGTAGLGALYFISAPAAGIALGLDWRVAALLAWVGYSLAGILVAGIGVPARDFLARRFKKLPDLSRNKLFHSCWKKGGLLGLGLISPVTIGPKGAALVGLAAGEKPAPLLAAVIGGAIPWAIGLAWATNYGFKFLG